MDNQEKGIRKIQLTSEMKTSFMNYAHFTATPRIPVPPPLL